MTDIVMVARRLSFIRETNGPNRGAWVEFLQRFTNGSTGDSWCADYVSVILDIAYRGKPPIKRSGSTQVMLADARVKGFVVTGDVHVRDLYFFLNEQGIAHHVGIVTGPATGISGNTSPDGTSSNGTGVFEHGGLERIPSHRIVFVRLPEPP